MGEVYNKGFILPSKTAGSDTTVSDSVDRTKFPVMDDGKVSKQCKSYDKDSIIDTSRCIVADICDDSPEETLKYEERDTRVETARKDKIIHDEHPNNVKCLDVAERFSFNLGTVIKLVWKANDEDDATAMKDLKEAEGYLARERVRLSKRRNN